MKKRRTRALRPLRQKIVDRPDSSRDTADAIEEAIQSPIDYGELPFGKSEATTVKEFIAILAARKGVNADTAIAVWWPQILSAARKAEDLLFIRSLSSIKRKVRYRESLGRLKRIGGPALIGRDLDLLFPLHVAAVNLGLLESLPTEFTSEAYGASLSSLSVSDISKCQVHALKDDRFKNGAGAPHADELDRYVAELRKVFLGITGSSDLTVSLNPGRGTEGGRTMKFFLACLAPEPFRIQDKSTEGAGQVRSVEWIRKALKRCVESRLK